MNLIDVGSANGPLPAPLRAHADQFKFTLRLDPQEEPGGDARSLSLPLALWSHRETREFFLNNNKHGSSFFKGSDQSLDTLLSLRCVPLDDLWPAFNRPFHVLKLDTQGAELEILHGAKNLLASPTLSAVVAEVWEKEIYQGAPRFPDVRACLEGQGYSLAWQSKPSGHGGAWRDTLFLKTACGSDPTTNFLRSIYKL